MILFLTYEKNFFWPGKTDPLIYKIFINKISNLDFNKIIKKFQKINFIKYRKTIKLYKIMNYDKDNKVIK